MKCYGKKNVGKILLFVIWGGNFILGIYYQKIILWLISIKTYILMGVCHVSLLGVYHYCLFVRIINYLVLIIYIGITKAGCF